MTESVAIQSPEAIRAALNAELLGVDAIARFKFEDSFKIHHLGEQIDSIPNLSPEYSTSLRKVANLFNEPDTESQAFDEPLPLQFPASQERYHQLQRATQFEEYLQFSQSQSQSISSSQLSQLPPAPNQQAEANQQKQLLQPPVVPSSAQARRPQKLQLPNQERPREPSPVRKSSRPAAPKIIKGYVMGDGEAPTSAKGKARELGDNHGILYSDEDGDDAELPSAARMSINARRSSTSNAPPRLSPSPGPSKKKARANPVPKRNAPPTEEERALLAQAKRVPTPLTEARRPLKNPVRPVAGRPSSRAVSQEAPLPPSPAGHPSATRRQTSARQSSNDDFLQLSTSDEGEGEVVVGGEGEGEGPSFLEIIAAQRSNSLEISREVARVPATTSKALTVSATGSKAHTANVLTVSKEDQPLSQAEREAKLGAPMYEGEFALSRAAKASLLGWTVAEGYEGFKYASTFQKGSTTKESWLCLKCGEPKTASMRGKPTNLKSHLRACNGPKTDAAAKRIQQAVEGGERRSAMAESSTLAGGSYRGSSVHGWLNAHQALDIDLTRRLALICVIKNALPFTLLSTVSMKRMIRSLDHRATTSFKSARQVQRDLKAFNSHLASNLSAELQGMDTLMALQHDGWTNKGFQHSFMGIIGSYVDAKWQYHERLLSFNVVQEKHSGATFAGHLIRTIQELKLDDKWFGTVTSDSAGTNTRMLTLMEHDLEEEQMQRRDPSAHQNDLSVQRMLKNSCSAFPRASLRNSGSWTADDYKILCLNHHINLAVRDGFAKFGIKVKTKTQRKVLDIRPKPSISVTDENGEDVIVSDGDDMESDDEEEEPEEDEDLEEGDDNVTEQLLGLLGHDTDEDDDDFVPEMAPEGEDIGSDDDGGPEANGDTDVRSDTDKVKPVNSVAKLAAFTTWIHRSSQRQAAFRRRMQKEYHRRPELASAPFPSKPNKTRWNSHFAMIRGALDIREAIDAHCRAHIGVRGEVLGDYLLTDTQWQQLKLLEPILGLAASVTKKMEKTEGTLYAVLDY
ncbi:hypothetical protein A4X13_0g8610, partial [Tilletia indica]